MGNTKRATGWLIRIGIQGGGQTIRGKAVVLLVLFASLAVPLSGGADGKVAYPIPPSEAGAKAALAAVRAPVLGLYGGDDARVTATVAPAEEKMKDLGKTFNAYTYPGAGHAFLRAQDGRDGANRTAS